MGQFGAVRCRPTLPQRAEDASQPQAREHAAEASSGLRQTDPLPAGEPEDRLTVTDTNEVASRLAWKSFGELFVGTNHCCGTGRPTQRASERTRAGICKPENPVGNAWGTSQKENGREFSRPSLKTIHSRR